MIEKIAFNKLLVNLVFQKLEKILIFTPVTLFHNMAANSEALVDAVKTEIEAASIPEIPDINGVEVKKETNENKAKEKSIITQLRLKKQAVMLCYCGRGYFGMQRQGW